jgi:sn-glycerol 3-phosphate transport system permease protein
MNKRRTFYLLQKGVFFLLIAVLVIVWIAPTVWAFVASTRPSADPVSRGDIWFGSTLTLESYLKAFRMAPFGRYFYNTTVLVLMVFGVQVVTVTLAAFAFAHFEFRGKSFLFMFILLQMMIPTTALLVPNFSTIRFLGIYDTILAIGIPYFGSAFGTFLMRQTFLGIPKSLVEAGIIDGCSWYQLLFHVYLPPAVPTVVAFGISSVNWHWSEFLWPLIITKSSEARPLTAGLVRFTQLGEIGARWSLLSAATVIVILPLLIAFFIFQKRFIQGFLHSGLK